jgi:hypothetical protein
MTNNLIDEVTLTDMEERAKHDDWHRSFVGSDIRLLIAEIRRLQEYEWMYKDLCE